MNTHTNSTIFSDYENVSKKDLFTWMINKGVPMEVVTRLHKLWDVTEQVGREIYRIGKIIVIEAVEFARRNPNMTTGMAIGLGISWLLSCVPILGWFIGPLVTTFITSYNMYQGHLKDNSEGNLYTMFEECFQVAVRVAREIKGDNASMVPSVTVCPA